MKFLKLSAVNSINKRLRELKKKLNILIRIQFSKKTVTELFRGLVFHKAKYLTKFRSELYVCLDKVFATILVNIVY